MIRWAVPALAVAAVGVATIAPHAVAEPALPPKTAEQLLVDLQNHDMTDLSGTVETRADLGLPALPGGDSSDVTALASGTNTVRVWQSGTEKSRVSLLGDNSETTVIRNGADVWQWSSESKTAKHVAMPDHDAHAKRHASADSPPAHSAQTPQEAAQEILAHLEPTTAVSVSQTARVAGRPAYELVLDPSTPDTLVAKVAIAVDSETNTPLRVEVWPVGGEQPALRVGFTQVSFDAPDDSVFAFTPPSDATVERFDPKTEHHARGDKPAMPHGTKAERPDPVVVGEGWDRVTVVTLPQKPEGQSAEPRGTEAAESETATQWQQTMDSLPTVQGSWGSGRVLTSSLFTMVMTDDGRVAVGMVPTERVVAAIPQ